MSDGRPAHRTPDPGPLSGPREVVVPAREMPAPVWIGSFRHEGIVLGNQQRTRDLAWLAGTWELAAADGRTLTGPAPLPALRPGETAAVPLPFALPRDGGEIWLTLRVATAEDLPWAPRGTEVCAPRLRLLPAPWRALHGAPAGAPPAPEPGGAALAGTGRPGFPRALALLGATGTRTGPVAPAVLRR
ncbi:DUF4981 domain-containing protein [Streptomyces adustus]|uniref:DUF4981 domain-containing protein n=1 Tax=Streptomyces adustus TaxID=1609272 RepID=UPI0035D75613